MAYAPLTPGRWRDRFRMYRWPHHWTGLIALPLQPLAPLAARAEDAAPRSPTEALQAIAAALPQDLSVWGMVVNADWMVRSVLTFLLAASVLTWTIALAKGLELRAERRRVQAGVAALNAAGSLDEAARRLMPLRGPCAILVRAAQEEVRMSVSGPGERLGRDGIKERAAWHLERLAATAVRSLGRGVGILATIGATAPFIGLFGTVWGIMNSFIGISRAQTTNLAVVAPGIAEALLATATGLFAAIPAVVIYNLFARATADRRADLLDAVAETMRLLSRDLDRGASGRLRAVGE